MCRPQHVFALFSLSVSYALTYFLTPTYPAPIDLSSNQSLVSASWKNISSIFDEYLAGNTNTSLGLENVTFSAGVFSLHDPTAIQLQYHYTAPEIADAKQGTNKVDEYSIYRIASVSKLITTFAGMVELTENDWNCPLADIVPALGRYARNQTKDQNALYTAQWTKITPGLLRPNLVVSPP